MLSWGHSADLFLLRLMHQAKAKPLWVKQETFRGVRESCPLAFIPPHSPRTHTGTKITSRSRKIALVLLQVWLTAPGSQKPCC